jgi:hypothetical protein
LRVWEKFIRAFFMHKDKEKNYSCLVLFMITYLILDHYNTWFLNVFVFVTSNNW